MSGREGALRRGLPPLPHVPPLPGRTAPEPRRELEDPGFRPEDPNAVRPAPRLLRPMEAQVDAELRAFLDRTAFAVRMRTGQPFDRSTLVRGILRAAMSHERALQSGCEVEADVTAALERAWGGAS